MAKADQSSASLFRNLEEARRASEAAVTAAEGFFDSSYGNRNQSPAVVNQGVSDAMNIVNRWRASNFERAAAEDVLAVDVEWVVPKHGGVTTVRGIDAVLEWYNVGGAAADVAAWAVRAGTLPEEELAGVGNGLGQ